MRQRAVPHFAQTPKPCGLWGWGGGSVCPVLPAGPRAMPFPKDFSKNILICLRGKETAYLKKNKPHKPLARVEYN